MRTSLLTTLTTIALSSTLTPVLAQQSLHAQLQGTWKITAEYDRYTDGHKVYSFGNNPQGIAEFTPNGTFIFVLMSGDRTAKPGTLPADPVAPAIAFIATYTVNEQNKTYTYHIQQCTFPQWNGISRTTTIADITPTTVKVVAMKVHNPQGGDLIPHIDYERVK